jgi:Tfp pilus assembly protein PilX
VGQICLTALASFAQVPWADGVSYAPSVPSPMTLTNTPSAGSYYATPEFYITFLGTTAKGQFYQIDAMAYGGNPDTAAVVETTYLVEKLVQPLSGGQ